MADFPENDIEIIPSFLLAAPTETWSAMREALASIDRDPVPPLDPGEGSVSDTAVLMGQVIKERRLLREVLQRCMDLCAVMEGVRAGLAKPSADALTPIDSLQAVGTGNGRIDLGLALRQSEVKVTIRWIEEDQRPPFRNQTIILRGYRGPLLDDAQAEQLRLCARFCADVPHQAFANGLLRTEAPLALAMWDDAVQAGTALSNNERPGSARRLRAAIRISFAHLRRGDQLFREKRNPGPEQRAKALEQYAAANRVLDDEGVAADNPRRLEIVDHATQQTNKLESGLNYLGLWESFVPVQTFTTLERNATERIRDAADEATKFGTLREKGDAVDQETRDLKFQAKEEERTLKLRELAKKNAVLAVEKIDEQIAAIDAQANLVNQIGSGLLGVGGAIVQGFITKAAPKVGGPLALAQGAIGVVGAILQAKSQYEQLEHQRHAANIERKISKNEIEGRRIEADNSRRRIAFLERKEQLIGQRLMSPDFLSALAEISEGRAERLLESAMLLAFLYERAVAFFLGKPFISHIKFDYGDRLKGVIGAAAALQEDFGNVKDEFVAPTVDKLDFFAERVSLRELYPVQFSRLLQTGEMEFAYSLYQLSRRRPASHQCRIREVGVEVVGSTERGFSGLLTHFGRFVVRDREATLASPEGTRLVPTSEEMERGFTEQREKGLAAAAVGGVVCYDLDHDTRSLSHETQFVSTKPPEQFVLDVFEGHAPTGLWKLSIQDHFELQIVDIVLHFALVGREPDPFDLGPRVQRMVRAYEAELAEGDQLDRFSAFSVRAQFSDAYFALRRGVGEFVLDETHFPESLFDLKFKAVLVQALDSNGKALRGLDLSIARQPAVFLQTRTTGADGFTEDLDEPFPTLSRDQRFPLLGEWQLRLGDPSQFERLGELGDLRVFFLYSFEQRTSAEDGV